MTIQANNMGSSSSSASNTATGVGTGVGVYTTGAVAQHISGRDRSHVENVTRAAVAAVKPEVVVAADATEAFVAIQVQNANSAFETYTNDKEQLGKGQANLNLMVNDASISPAEIATAAALGMLDD